MKAVILAAGIGKRIPEFTADIPKCLIPITSSVVPSNPDAPVMSNLA